MLRTIEMYTNEYKDTTKKEIRKKKGQFFTPAEVSMRMAAVENKYPKNQLIRVLDPGAGNGILSFAVFARYPNAHTTYGSETTPHRKELGLEKTHYNDAITISGITNIKEDPKEWLLIKQFRKKKRSLHEATARKGRKEPNCFQKRNSKNTPFYRGFYLNDKVKVFGHGQIGYITGFTSGGAYVKNVDGEYITIPNKSYKQVSIKYLKLLSHNNNWQYVVKSAV